MTLAVPALLKADTQLHDFLLSVGNLISLKTESIGTLSLLHVISFGFMISLFLEIIHARKEGH